MDATVAAAAAAAANLGMVLLLLLLLRVVAAVAIIVVAAATVVESMFACLSCLFLLVYVCALKAHFILDFYEISVFWPAREKIFKSRPRK